MAIRVVIAGATGWVGKALVPAVLAEDDMTLAGAVSRMVMKIGSTARATAAIMMPGISGQPVRPISSWAR